MSLWRQEFIFCKILASHELNQKTIKQLLDHAIGTLKMQTDRMMASPTIRLYWMNPYGI